MHRFFLAPNEIAEDRVLFPAPAARQIARVLRMSTGDTVTALDNSGWEYTVELTQVGPRSARGSITERRRGKAEPAMHLTMYQAALKTDKFEWALQKGTELGVSRFVPIVTRRTIRRDAGASANRQDRWHRIIREAAEQSGRSKLPELSPPTGLEEALRSAPQPAVMAWEREAAFSLDAALDRLRDLARSRASISTFVGPEGGFDPDEVDLAVSCGVSTISLGRRILRAETAAVALVSAIMYEFGELAP